MSAIYQTMCGFEKKRYTQIHMYMYVNDIKNIEFLISYKI